MNHLIHNDILVEQLSYALDYGGSALKNVPGLLKKVLQEQAWKERTIRKTGELRPYDQFLKFVQDPPLDGLGADLQILKNICRDDNEALDLIDQALQRSDGNPTGSNQHRAATVDNVNTSNPGRPTGNSCERALRTLRSSRPDLHERVIAGEVTPHAAMVEAGFRPRTLTIRLDPRQAAAALLRHFSDAEIAELVEALVSPNGG